MREGRIVEQQDSDALFVDRSPTIPRAHRGDPEMHAMTTIMFGARRTAWGARRILRRAMCGVGAIAARHPIRRHVSEIASLAGPIAMGQLSKQLMQTGL